MLHSPIGSRGWGCAQATPVLLVLASIGLAWPLGAEPRVAPTLPEQAFPRAAAALPADLDDLQVLEQRIQAAMNKVAPAVVAVSGGSGVVVSEDGYVLTVAHVGERAGRNVTVTLSSGRRVRGKTLGNDQGVDAGMVKILEEGPWPFVEMGRSADLQPGQWCLTLGYPVSFERGKPPVLRIGRVLRNAATMIMADCKIMGGDSGGPLIDLDGRVIGIGSRCDDRVTMNIHVPIDCYHQEWDRLVNGEDFNSLVRPIAYFGVAPFDDPRDDRIREVAAGSAAEKAGVQVGDLILRFGGKTVNSYDDLPALIQEKKPGDRVEVEVRRGNETMTLSAVLGRSSG